MNKRLRFVSMFLALLCAALAFTGCMGGDKYTEEQEALIVEQGKPLLEEFLASLAAENLEVTSYYMTEAAAEGSLIYGGLYPANAVTVNFTADGEKYRAIVDLETGIVYSDYYIFDVNPYIEKQLKPYCERYGFTGDYTVEGAEVCLTIHSQDVAIDGDSDKLVNSYSDIEGMIPVIFNQPDENERAEAFLKDAPLSGFSIEFGMQNDEFFDPRILADYLTESGNYKGERTWESGWKFYKISGVKSYDKFPERGICSWETYLNFEGDVRTMPYIMSRSDFYKEKEFCFTYTAAVKRGRINDYETDKWEEYEFPLEMEEGKFSYHIYDGIEPVYLNFEEKPPYTFTRTCYEFGPGGDIISEKTENLVLVQNDSGMWYLTPENDPKACYYSYKFDREQDLEFR